MIALSLRNKVTQLQTRNHQNVKKRKTASLWWKAEIDQGTSWKTSRSHAVGTEDGKLFQRKKEETGDTFDSQKNRSCPKMQMLKFQD